MNDDDDDDDDECSRATEKVVQKVSRHGPGGCSPPGVASGLLHRPCPGCTAPEGKEGRMLAGLDIMNLHNFSLQEIMSANFAPPRLPESLPALARSVVLICLWSAPCSAPACGVLNAPQYFPASLCSLSFRTFTFLRAPTFLNLEISHILVCTTENSCLGCSLYYVS